MYKLLLLFSVVCFAACSNSGTSKRSADSVSRSSALPNDSFARVAQFSFIDGCIENAKLTLGDQKAFAFCKCIYEQLQKENPSADSVALDNLAMDTARIAKMAAACRN